MKKIREKVIYCINGVICKTNEGAMVWCWKYEDMDKFGKDKPSDVVIEVLKKIAFSYEMGHEIEFDYSADTVEELL